MRNTFILIFSVLISAGAFAQYPYLQVSDINDASMTDLQNCDDTSSYYLDTVTIVCYVVTDGNLCEVASSSINGANGVRPFIWVNDTANNGLVGPNTGLEVMGVNWNTSQATSGFTSLIAGDLIEITGVVGMFANATQFQPLDNNSITILTSTFPTITPAQVMISELNDQNQVNNLVTGEKWEGAFIEVNNVIVTSVNPFGSGTNARVDFTVADSAGNTMQVYDFFIAQRLSTWTALNPNSPYTNGIFTIPSVGTVYSSLKGVVEHSGNGCTGGGGSGYRIHPFDSTHYVVGQAFPTIANVNVNPSIPTSSDPIDVSADIGDADGSIDSVHIFWTTNPSDPFTAYTKNVMTNTSGSTYSYTIPMQANGTDISYFIRAVDNDANVTFYPGDPDPSGSNAAKIYVRDNGLTIMDIQTPTGSGDASPFEGQNVTIRGYVSAANRDCDLGYVYIQDTSASEYSGIALRGSLDLDNLYRNEYVQIHGLVQESFGFTQILVDSLKSLGMAAVVQPVPLDPSDGNADNEKYESMLVTYADPGGGTVYVTNENLGFGEYAISNDPNPAGSSNQRRVLAGRQSGSSAQSSLWVSLVSDTSYATSNGTMNVPAIATSDTMTMDGMTGILWYSFGAFKLTPRNNFDIHNLNVPLDTSSCFTPGFDIVEIGSNGEFAIYPNPTNGLFTVEGSGEEINVEIFDLKGSLISTAASENEDRVVLDASNYQPGFYIVRVTGGKNSVGTYKLIVTD